MVLILRHIYRIIATPIYNHLYSGDTNTQKYLDVLSPRASYKISLGTIVFIVG